jgi:hypothetical protein
VVCDFVFAKDQNGRVTPADGVAGVDEKGLDTKLLSCRLG